MKRLTFTIYPYSIEDTNNELKQILDILIEGEFHVIWYEGGYKLLKYYAGRYRLIDLEYDKRRCPAKFVCMNAAVRLRDILD